MDILHKTQKQHLPLILFFFNTQCNFGKKKEAHSKAGIDKQLHFLSNPTVQTKPAWKKKEEISLNNKTFAFNHQFCRENV